MSIYILIISILFSCSKENTCLEEHFYYYDDSKHFIDNKLLKNYIIIGFEQTTTNKDIVIFINNQNEFENITDDKIIEFIDHKIVAASLTSDKNCNELKLIINNIKINNIVFYANYAYNSSAWIGFQYFDIMSYSNEFSVKVKDTNNLIDLNNVAKETNTIIKGQKQYRRQWFYLSTNKNSQGNALEMSNYFHETGKFIVTTPSFFDINLK